MVKMLLFTIRARENDSFVIQQILYSRTDIIWFYIYTANLTGHFERGPSRTLALLITLAPADGKAGIPNKIPQCKDLCWSQVRTKGQYCSKEELFYFCTQNFHLDVPKILCCKCLQHLSTTNTVGLPGMLKEEQD